MPLADWLGRPRAEGFAEQLRLVAEGLRLDGSTEDGFGLYRVWGRDAPHLVTVCMENGGVAVRAFSNVRFTPGGLPREVTAALMRWRTPDRHLIWDAHSCAEWSCYVMRCSVAMTSFSAQVLAHVMEEELGEVAALDRMLAESNYGRLSPPEPCRAARPAVRAPESRPALGPPRPAQSLVHRAIGEALRLLGGR